MNNLFSTQKHSDTCKDQESSKEIYYPVNLLQQKRSGGNQNATHNKRPQDAPEENTILIYRRYMKHTKEQDKNENVIDTERFLYQVTGEELNSNIKPFEDINTHIEEHCQSNPHRTPKRCLF